MKSVTIYSIGSCVTETRKGLFEVVLAYGEHRKYLTEAVNDTTANRCVILGLIAAVKLLKEPCNVTLITTTRVGLRGLAKGKGPNLDLLHELISLLSEKQCEFEFNELEGEGKSVNAFVKRAADASA